MVKIKSRRGMNTHQIGGIMIAMILAGVILFVFFIGFLGQSKDIIHLVQEEQKLISGSEDLLALLRMPVEGKGNLGLNPTNELMFSEGSLLNFDFLSKKSYNFNLILNNKAEIPLVMFQMYPGKGSNVAIIEGSYDNVEDLLNKNGIYPIIVDWDDFFNGEYDVLFLGPGVNVSEHENDIKSWITFGGRLITSDYSIDALEKILGEENPLEGVHESVKTSPLVIDLTSAGQSEFGTTKILVKKVYLKVNIKEGSQVTSLGGYGNLAECKGGGCGSAIYKFPYGTGEIFYFAFQLSQMNSLLLPYETIEAIFKPIFENPVNPRMSYNGEVFWKRDLEFKEQEGVDITGRVKTHYFLNCETYPCEVPFTLEADGGKVILKDPILYEKRDTMLLSKEMDYTVTDLIVESYYDDNYTQLEEIVEEYYESLSGQHHSYSFSIRKNGKGGKLLSTGINLFPKLTIEEIYLVGETKIPLLNPDEYLAVNVERIEVSS